jgi:zinc protease
VSSSRLIFSRIAAAYLLLAVVFTPAAAQNLSPQELAAPLPLDSAIRTGTLPNGLTFFIRRNVEPANRAALRLAVKAGSIDEADDQRGLAHLLEHMAFNGSEHFSAGELVKYLESIGSRFGPDVNAYTSFDETVYMLEVPTDKPPIIERGFEALGDFAGGIALDTAEIDKERGVVIEEWRLRQGAQSRMQDAQLQGLFGESRYVQRLPIGLPEILKSFPAERIRDFYRDHYRADRMAVIVVGDVDVAAIEAQIRRHFAGLAARPPATRPVYPVPPHRETRYVTTSDREAQSSSVSIVHKRALQTFRTVGDYRRSLLGSLVDQMLNSRLAEIARRPEARFLGASVGGQTLGQTVEGFTVGARTKDGGIAEGLEAIAQEIARVTQHGFGDAELDRAKKGMIAGLERAYNERDKSQSGGFASELVRHFLTGEPAPGIAMELDLARRFLPGMTAADAGALARELLGDESRVVLAVSPEKEGIAPVTQAVLTGALRMGLTASVEPWRDALEGRALMADLPAAGSVGARREIPEIGVTVLTLSNGVEVWLKPTDFRNDQVSFTSYARGGVSLASEAEYLNASLSTSIVGLSGVGGINPVDMGKLLAGKIANASTYVSNYTHGVSGGSTPRDLETALQLTYLQFTSPNRDPQALDLMKRRLEANLANQAQNPGSVFGERVRLLNTLSHFSSRSLKVEDLARLDAARMHEFYEARFRNAADFTFFFVGAFTVDEITPLVAQYLGSLPSAGKPASAIGSNLRLQFPAGVQRETVRKGQEPRSQTSITFFADTGLEEFETHRVRAATSILQNRLRDILREELGGTYSVGVGYSDTTPQPGYGTTSVSFGSAPENVEKLTAAVMTELDRLRREGPTDTDVQVVIETERRDLETSLKTNNYWLNSLQTAHLLGRDPRAILQRIARAETLTRANIHEMFKKYFPETRHTVVTLMPEVAPPRAGAQ